MNITTEFIRLAESVSIIRHCNLTENEKAEYEKRIFDSQKNLDYLGITYAKQNKAVYIGEKIDIRAVGYAGIDSELKKIYI